MASCAIDLLDVVAAVGACDSSDARSLQQLADATRAARELLRRAVSALEASRAPARKAGRCAWHARRGALLGGHWSLLDSIELDGRRYVVVCDSTSGAHGPEALSPRERQVVAYAKLGHHSKLIAFELGIADSTVRVLLSRAAAKLGVRTRLELLDMLSTTSCCNECEPPSPPR